MNDTQTIFIITTISLWVIVTVYWIVSSKTISSENHRGKELFSFLKLIGSSLIIYFPLLTGGLISTSLFQTSLTSGLTGLTFCILGIAIMVWARQHLGKNWSGNVTIQQGHTISRSGPYEYVRHPIYSGGLLAMCGSAIVLGQIFGFIWVLFCAFGLTMKIKQEENLLTKQFPDEYPLYKKQVKKLIPFIW
jgi:protein-S-isoprenylcysteine O-methyltransferase Ste14